MKKIEKERQWRRRRRLGRIMSLVFLAVVFLATAQLIVSNRLANLGQEIEKEKEQTEVLILENSIMEEKIRQKESLVDISEKAKELGFVETKSVYYLTPQIPVAMK